MVDGFTPHSTSDFVANDASMGNSNTLFLQTTSVLMNGLDIRYTTASLEDRLQLKKDLDRAIMTFSEIRSKILEGEVICTTEDVAHIQALRQEIEQTEEIQALLAAIARLTHTLAGL